MDIKIKRVAHNKLSWEQVKQSFLEVHGEGIYGYNDVEYVDTHTPIKVFCEKHKHYFYPTPKNHKKGSGCNICGREGTTLAQIKTKEHYIEQVSIIHSNLYTYDKVDYKGCRKNIIVTCNIHGDFTIQANNHLHNHGCTECAKEIQRYNGWKYPSWVEFGNKSKKFIAFQVYLIKCSDLETSEVFYKIGKTFKDIKNRFSSKSLPYSYEVLKIIKGEGEEISILENKLHKQYSNFKYKPEKKFGGSSECFNMELPINKIINFNIK